MRFSPRKLIFLLLGALGLAFLLYHLRGMLHLSDFSGEKLIHAVRGADPRYLLLSVAAIYVCYALRAIRWKVFQKNLGRSDFGNIYKMTLAGFSAVFLFGRAGEPLRPLLLARKEKLPVADMFGIFVLERLFDTASAAVIAALGLFFFQAQAHESGTSQTLEANAKTASLLFFGAVFVATGFLIYLRLHGTALLERRLQGWMKAHGWRTKVARIVMGFTRGIQMIRSWGDLLLASSYSAMHWFLVVIIYYWVAHSFGGKLATISLQDSMLVLAITLVGSVVQLPAVGGGSQAACIFAFTKIFGIETESAFAAALVLWAITFASCSLAGVPLLIREGWSMGELRRMAEHEDEEIDAGAGFADTERGSRRGESVE
ncbi:MAG: lysylphosphatidylglycerol synthase transmembrane domain-containing protein [Candidatus Acidiferrum sp.]